MFLPLVFTLQLVQIAFLLLLLLCQFKFELLSKENKIFLTPRLLLSVYSIAGNAIRTVVEAGYARGESRDKRSWSRKRCSMTSQKWYTIKKVSYMT